MGQSNKLSVARKVGHDILFLVIDFAGNSGQQRELVLISQPMQRLGGLQEGPT
jgi:hypothetical protein